MYSGNGHHQTQKQGFRLRTHLHYCRSFSACLCDDHILVWSIVNDDCGSCFAVAWFEKRGFIFIWFRAFSMPKLPLMFIKNGDSVCRNQQCPVSFVQVFCSPQKKLLHPPPLEWKAISRGQKYFAKPVLLFIWKKLSLFPAHDSSHFNLQLTMTYY